MRAEQINAVEQQLITAALQNGKKIFGSKNYYNLPLRYAAHVRWWKY